MRTVQSECPTPDVRERSLEYMTGRRGDVIQSSYCSPAIGALPAMVVADVVDLIRLMEIKNVASQVNRYLIARNMESARQTR
jgi:hypothetical protein